MKCQDERGDCRMRLPSRPIAAHRAGFAIGSTVGPAHMVHRRRSARWKKMQWALSGGLVQRSSAASTGRRAAQRSAGRTAGQTAVRRQSRAFARKVGGSDGCGRASTQWQAGGCGRRLLHVQLRGVPPGLQAGSRRSAGSAATGTWPAGPGCHVACPAAAAIRPDNNAAAPAVQGRDTPPSPAPTSPLARPSRRRSLWPG